MQLLDFLQSVSMEALVRKAEQEPSGSNQWHLNYKLCINPKLQCPYCREWLDTLRVWVIDEIENKVRKLWTLDGHELGVECCHPHVGSAGRICMGDARTATDALFAGLSSDAYISPWEWLPDVLGHECGKLLAERDAEDEHHFTCQECDDRYHEDDVYWSDGGYGPYCSNCYYERYDRCHKCDSEWENGELKETPRGEYWCESCFAEQYFECEDCDGTFSNDEYMGYNLCETCWNDRYVSCPECGEDFYRPVDWTDMCPDCQPEPEEEGTDNETV